MNKFEVIKSALEARANDAFDPGAARKVAEELLQNIWSSFQKGEEPLKINKGIIEICIPGIVSPEQQGMLGLLGHRPKEDAEINGRPHLG